MYLTTHDGDQTISATKCVCFLVWWVKGAQIVSFPAISHLNTEVLYWKMFFFSHVVSPHSKPLQFRDDEFICLVQTWCFFILFLTSQRRASPACHSSAHTDTNTQGGGGEFRGHVCISGWSSGSFCAPRGPWPVREGGQTSGILSPRAWVGCSSSQGVQREEEMKLLAFVAVLGIKDGVGIKGAPSVRKTPARVPVCTWVRGAGGAGGQANHFSDKSSIIFPTSAWPWWISCSVTQNSINNSFSPLKRMHHRRRRESRMCQEFCDAVDFTDTAHVLLRRPLPSKQNNYTFPARKKPYFSWLASAATYGTTFISNNCMFWDILVT